MALSIKESETDRLVRRLAEPTGEKFTGAVKGGHALLVNHAFLRFGKGRHKASLNHGDCFAFALAKGLDAPLLFKGDDFSHTDVRAVL